MGNKMPIEWHEENLKIWKAYMEEERAILDIKRERLTKDFNNWLFYQKQLEAAKAKGMDGFDRDRFMVKRGEK